MADQHRWFKLWATAPYDDSLLRLSVADRWAWAVLGTYTKVHGNRGIVTLSESNLPLAAAMGIPATELCATVTRLPHVKVHFEEGQNRHGEFTVTWKNWIKYQVDSTQAERAKSSRSKRRGEEKRGEEKRIPSVSPHRDQAKTILIFLNDKAHKSFRPTDANLSLIVARLRSGATEEDCRSLIAKKVREWLPDPKMAMYLRPATLFNATKFEQYLGEMNGHH